MNRGAKIIAASIALREAEDLIGDLIGDSPQESDAVGYALDFVRQAIEQMREAV